MVAEKLRSPSADLILRRRSGKVEVVVRTLTSLNIGFLWDQSQSQPFKCFLLEDLFYFLNYVYVGGIHRCPQKPERMSDALELRVTGGCKPFSMGVRPRTWILCMSGKHS